MKLRGARILLASILALPLLAACGGGGGNAGDCFGSDEVCERDGAQRTPTATTPTFGGSFPTPNTANDL